MQTSARLPIACTTEGCSIGDCPACRIDLLRSAWGRYAENASILDGHTKDCAARRAPNCCTCGYAAVESAIRAVIWPKAPTTVSAIEIEWRCAGCGIARVDASGGVCRRCSDAMNGGDARGARCGY